jgi:cellulose synthase/poly-beta-1,6-N-acetylglucosamine synthase-like glycosyltransferase
MEWIIITIYSLSLLIITIFSLGQLNLTLHYLKKRKHKPEFRLPENLPRVTVQLPVYNERYVVERLIRSVAELDYPQELLEIQVLDDSTDETKQLIDEVVGQYQNHGIDIKAVRREVRTGYKAGALQYGLELAKGDFVAIFDADFMPRKDFLLQTLGYFTNDNIGLVQTRWEHLNQNYSILTRMQAFGLDAHFTVEQSGRNLAGSFINFNGTAGIWRKECISDAGGWQHDTLTEDLDLSYRAQLNGWKFIYVQDVGSPAELPVVVPAIKSQQYRWNKGAAETARKNLGKVLKAPLALPHKTRAVLHLLNSSVFFFLLTAAILSIPMLYLKRDNPQLAWVFDAGSIFIVGFVAMSIFYWFSSKSLYAKGTAKYYLTHFPLFLSFSMGMALHNSIAILEGFLGKKTAFVRTPKFNIIDNKDSWKDNMYLKEVTNPITILEGLLMLYFAFGVWSGLHLGDYGLILFHFMMMMGFGLVFVYTFKTFSNAKA